MSRWEKCFNTPKLYTTAVCRQSNVLEKYVIYLQYFILGQIILPLNITENFDKYQCKSDEVKFVIPLYDSETGELKGIDAK